MNLKGYYWDTRRESGRISTWQNRFRFAPVDGRVDLPIDCAENAVVLLLVHETDFTPYLPPNRTTKGGWEMGVRTKWHPRKVAFLHFSGGGAYRRAVNVAGSWSHSHPLPVNPSEDPAGFETFVTRLEEMFGEWRRCGFEGPPAWTILEHGSNWAKLDFLSAVGLLASSADAPLPCVVSSRASSYGGTIAAGAGAGESEAHTEPTDSLERELGRCATQFFALARERDPDALRTLFSHDHFQNGLVGLLVGWNPGERGTEVDVVRKAAMGDPAAIAVLKEVLERWNGQGVAALEAFLEGWVARLGTSEAERRAEAIRAASRTLSQLLSGKGGRSAEKRAGEFWAACDEIGAFLTELRPAASTAGGESR